MNNQRWEPNRRDEQDQFDRRGGQKDPWRTNQDPGRNTELDHQNKEQVEMARKQEREIHLRRMRKICRLIPSLKL